MMNAYPDGSNRERLLRRDAHATVAADVATGATAGSDDGVGPSIRT